MDPVTQGLLGSAVSQSVARKDDLRIAAALGCIAGMAADLDVLLVSPDDPLFSIEFHRHFTHSLAFVPVGAFICALFVWLILRRRRRPLSTMFLWALPGYAAGILIDACTSYGTRLYWPFSDHRAAWDVIAIIDPLFTGVLLAAVILALVKKRKWFAWAGAAFALAYLCFGLVQRERAVAGTADLAAKRGHAVQRITAKPTLFNLVLWRGIYQSGDRFYVAAVRVGLFSPVRIHEGPSVKKFLPETGLPHGLSDTVLYKDVLRFAHFSDDYMYRHPDDDAVIGDLRYSLMPDTVRPLWGIKLDLKNPDRHVKFIYYRNVTREKIKTFLNMVLGGA